MPILNEFHLTVLTDSVSTTPTNNTPISNDKSTATTPSPQSSSSSTNVDTTLESNEEAEIIAQNKELHEYSIQKICHILLKGTDQEIINLLNTFNDDNKKYVLNILANTQMLEMRRNKADYLAKMLLNQDFAKKYITGAVLAEFEAFLHSDWGTMQLHDSTFLAVIETPFPNRFGKTKALCKEEGIPYVPELIKLYKRKYQEHFPDAPIARLIKMKETQFYLTRITAFNELAAILDENEYLEECKTTFEEIIGHLMISGIDETTKQLLMQKLARHPKLLDEIMTNLPQLAELEAAFPHRNNESFSKWLMQCALAGFDFAKAKLNAKTELLDQTNELLCQMIEDKECTLADIYKIFSAENLGEMCAYSLTKRTADPFILAMLKEFEDSNYNIQTITAMYGVDGRNSMLAFYFEQAQVLLNWPQQENNVKEKIICQLLLNNKITVKDVLEHGLTLINRCGNVANRKYFLTVLENNMTFNLNALMVLTDSHQVLFPLVNSGIISLEEIKSCPQDSIKFFIYRDFAETIHFGNPADPQRQELVEIKKLFASKTFQTIKKDFLDPLEAEIEKLKTGADAAELDRFIAFKKRITKIILGLKDCKNHSKKTLRLNLIKVASQFFLDQGRSSQPVQRIIDHFINNNCDIAAVTKTYGVASRNNLLHFYFNQHDNKFVWPRAQKEVEGNIVCELVLDGKMPLKTALAASRNEMSRLAHPTIAAYLREMARYDRKLNFAKIFACEPAQLHMFPLIDNNLLTAEELTSLAVDSSIEYKILTTMTHVYHAEEDTKVSSRSSAVVKNDSPSSAKSSSSQASVRPDDSNPEWTSLHVARLRTAIAYFKSDEFAFIKREVLTPIKKEIARLQQAKSGLFTESGNMKMLQMQAALNIINGAIQKQFKESLMPASEQKDMLINTDTKAFTQKLNATVFRYVKLLAKQPTINAERNVISKFFCSLLKRLYWFAKPFVREYNPNTLFKSATGKKVAAIETVLNLKRSQLA